VNGDFSFLWGNQKFDPHRTKTNEPIEIKIGRFDYVGEGTRRAKFYANPSKGASRQMGEIYAKNFIVIYLFSETHLQVRPFGGWLKRRGLAQGCVF